MIMPPSNKLAVMIILVLVVGFGPAGCTEKNDQTLEDRGEDLIPWDNDTAGPSGSGCTGSCVMLCKDMVSAVYGCDGVLLDRQDEQLSETQAKELCNVLDGILQCPYNCHYVFGDDRCDELLNCIDTNCYNG